MKSIAVQKSSLRLVSLVLSFAMVGGCAQLVPGLNVAAVEEGVHPFSAPGSIATRTMDTTQWPPYGPREVPPLPSAVPEPVASKVESYEVVRVTPAVVARMRQAGNTALDDAASSLPAVIPSDVPPEYRIGPGDVLFVTVWGHPELSQPVSGGQQDLVEKEGRLVASDGSMFFPYAGSMHVAGLTTRELREVLGKRLMNVIVDPVVDVKVVAYRAHRVQVTGEVEKPGTLTLDDTPKGILQALGASGGLTPEASRRRVTLVRNNVSYPIDLAALYSGDVPARNPKLQPGDEIHVPNRSRDSVFVLGEVKNNQPVVMQETTMPLVEALTASGGMATLRANDSGVLVFRVNAANSNVTASVYALDMANAEGMLLASQFPLNASDIVYVMTTALANYNAVIEQILPTFMTVWLGDRIIGNGNDITYGP